jgi:hypothetical protein
MSDLFPALIAFAFIGAAFIYGYLTDPYRHHHAATLQPAHGEPKPKSSSLASEMSEIR